MPYISKPNLPSTSGSQTGTDCEPWCPFGQEASRLFCRSSVHEGHHDARVQKARICHERVAPQDLKGEELTVDEQQGRGMTMRMEL